MTQEQLSDLLEHKPTLVEVKDKIKYAVFITLVQRGWKGVGSSFSGVLTKNDFVLNLYKSDPSSFELKESSEFLVPTAICYFTVPNTSWTLERYNKLYGYGRMQSIWEFLYETPEKADDSETFMKFIEEVDSTANLSSVELQSLGQLYKQEDYFGYTFAVHKGNIVDTGIFISRVSFGSIQANTVYKIKTTTVSEQGEKVFVLTQLEPKSVVETIMTLEDFSNHYQAGDLTTLTAKQETKQGELQLVQASGSARSGLPKVIADLEFSSEKQSFIGEALKERLYLTPLLLADDSNIKAAFELLKLSHEYSLLNKLPSDPEMLDVLLEYARAGFSLYQPMNDDNASDARFELSEVLESTNAVVNNVSAEIGANAIDLWKFEKTFMFSIDFKKVSSANYLYLQALQENGYFSRLCSPMLSNTMTDSSGTLYLHRVYVDYDAQNELRAFFYEEGMEDLFERTMSEFTHLYFDWRSGFGLCCVKYTLVRVPGGYQILARDRKVLGYMLKVNGTVYNYGDLTCLRK